MNDRYTSPALSRDLASAGLDCTPGPHWHTDHQGAAGWALHVTDSLTCKGVRALDLTDVLREIEKRGATWLVETDNGTYCTTVVLSPKFSTVMGGPTAVEAAALCLLALMDKLSEAKP